LKILITVNFGIIISTSAVTQGKHTFYLTLHELQSSLYFSFFTFPLWLWSISCTKISVLLMLLRIKPNWKRGITIFITFVLLNCVAVTLLQLLQCRPIKANWDISIPRSSCISADSLLKATYITSCKSPPHYSHWR
jgi:hypothetical protein